jgi:hypothetical protein
VTRTQFHGEDGKTRLVLREGPAGGRSTSYAPAAAMEWRAYATVRALSILRDNAMIDAPA